MRGRKKIYFLSLCFFLLFFLLLFFLFAPKAKKNRSQKKQTEVFNPFLLSIEEHKIFCILVCKKINSQWDLEDRRRDFLKRLVNRFSFLFRGTNSQMINNNFAAYLMRPKNFKSLNKQRFQSLLQILCIPSEIIKKLIITIVMLNVENFIYNQIGMCHSSPNMDGALVL